MSRFRAKVDQNQAHIVKHLRAAGCSVQSLAELGHGVPDLLVACQRQLYLLEIKNPDMAPSRRKLTGDQEVWVRRWRGPVTVVHSPEEALRAVGAGMIRAVVPPGTIEYESDEAYTKRLREIFE